MKEIFDHAMSATQGVGYGIAQILIAHREEIVIALTGMMVLYGIIEFKRGWTELHKHSSVRKKKRRPSGSKNKLVLIRAKLMLALLPTPFLYYLMHLFFETVRVPAGA
jgi:hypothetical protein